MPPEPSNSTAVAALTLAILALLIGWFPICGSIPALLLALVGLPLAIVALSAAAKPPPPGYAPRGKGLPTTALVLCILGLALSAFATISPVRFISKIAQAVVAEHEAEKQRRADAEANPSPYAGVPLYTVMSENHLAGLAFIITTPSAGLFAVTAAHPFDGETPLTLLPPMLDPDLSIPLAHLVYTGEDVFALRLAPDASPPGPHLHYPGPMPINRGDRLIILTEDGPIPAVVTEKPLAFLPGQARLEKSFLAFAHSGAPVLLESTGTPVALLVAADDPRNPTLVDFMRLQIPTDPTSPRRR